jgi:hypothetical protein
MANTYDNIMTHNNTDVWSEISRVLLLIMYALMSKAVTGYHFVKDKYLEYKYATDENAELKPTDRYFLSSKGREDHFNSFGVVPTDWVYIEEWNDIRGHKKMIARYPGDKIPSEWTETPFDLPPAKCPWVWVGDRETEVDLTRTFDKFLVPGNLLTTELVSKLTDQKNLIYIETKTFNQIKFPGDGITIEEDVE